MKIEETTWRIKGSDGEIQIKGTGIGLPGGGNTTVSVTITTLTLVEKKNEQHEKEYSGEFEVEPASVSRLSKIGQHFQITLNQRGGDVPPFREIIGCSMIGEPNTITHFTASTVKFL